MECVNYSGDSPHLARASPRGGGRPRPPGAMPLDKVRIRFRKSGDLRLVSHLDLIRSFERMLRRAALPFVDSLSLPDGALLVSVWITQDGSARAQEVATAVGLADLPLIERVELELWDEVPPEEAARTPKIEPQSRPMYRVLSAEPVPVAPREAWGATANGPVVE